MFEKQRGERHRKSDVSEVYFEKLDEGGVNYHGFVLRCGTQRRDRRDRQEEHSQCVHRASRGGVGAHEISQNVAHAVSILSRPWRHYHGTCFRFATILREFAHNGTFRRHIGAFRSENATLNLKGASPVLVCRVATSSGTIKKCIRKRIVQAL